MSLYLKQFETTAEYNAAKPNLILPNVSLITENNKVEYNPIVSATGVTLNKSELSLNKGATETLVATVLPSDTSNKSVTWSSSNNSVATVSNNGLVTAVGSGNATITVTTVDGGHTAQCTFNITVSVTGVTLNKSELSLNKGATETLVATVLPSDASNKNVTWSSSNDSVATVSNNGLVTAVGIGNANITVTTVDGGHTAQCETNIINCTSEIIQTTYDWVEIGGIKWATKNVGALTVTDYGQKFSWGGVNGYTNDQVSGGCHEFSWANYEYGNGTSSPGATGITKYNSTDGLITLIATDDAATVNMGSGWRMPTSGDFGTLIAATTNQWVTDYQGSGVNGRLFTDKTDSSKTLFFPAAGRCEDGSVNVVGSYGQYWSSSRDTGYAAYGRYLNFYSGKCNMSNYNRHNGYSVRGVYVG